jgi:hypothetical protein
MDILTFFGILKEPFARWIMNKNARWYDKHKTLASLLEGFREMPKEQRDSAVEGVMALIKNFAPQLFDKNVLDFPIDFNRRRWYDREPNLWLLFNGLKFADNALLMKVIHYLSHDAK